MAKAKHPQPKKVKAYNSTAFGPNTPGTTPTLEYDPPGEEDYMRYRMHRLWSKDPSNLSVSFTSDDGPIVVSEDTPKGDDPYLIESRNNASGLFQFPSHDRSDVVNQ